MSAGLRLRDPVADQRMVDTPSLLAYLPWILSYPITGHALAALILFTALLWIGLQSVAGIALLAIASPWVFQYAQAVIERTAVGQATPPVFGGDMLYLGGLSALRPLLGLGLLAGAWQWTRSAHPGAEAAVLVVGALLYPAHLLLLATDERLSPAFNPLALLHVIAGVGLSYPAVCLLLAAAAWAAWSVASQAGLALALFVLIYAWLMTCHLLGFVVFHRAEQLGLSAPDRTTTDEKRAQAEFQARLDGVLARVDAALSRRDLQAAADTLYAEPGDARRRRAFHVELFEQLERRRQPPLLHVQGARLIALLLAEHRVAQALEVAGSCVDARADFAPERPEHAMALLEEALRTRQDGLFDRLLAAAIAQWPDGPQAVTLRFLAARASCELKHDDAHARELLKPLLNETGHPQHRQIVALARALAVRD
ncbi:hypothetical protein AAG565_10230 [Fontimonas sp. SYSU GA230001]|uniref:hypothetical protein n=1 Tax=Fontimonas sp. SYSU GA230001 TaxID=3142450 RepID=UPI0032B4AF24